MSLLGESEIHHVVGAYVNLPEKIHVHASFLFSNSVIIEKFTWCYYLLLCLFCMSITYA